MKLWQFSTKPGPGIAKDAPKKTGFALLIDVLARRTRAHLRDRAACLAAAPEVAALLGRELHWSDEEIARQVADYRAMCAAEVAATSTAASTAAESPA